MYDIVVIGGGISSLYFCYRLINKRPNLKILIIEKNNRLGGRIYTGEYNDYKYELGAGRFSKSHKLLMTLLQELGLDSKLVENSSKVDYYVNYQKKNKKKIKNRTLIEKGIKLSNIEKKEFYRYNMYHILEKGLKKKELKSVINTSPYLGEYFLQNGESFINNSLMDFYSKRKYYSLKGGLSQMVKLLKSYLTNLVDIHLGEECTNINKNGNCFAVTGDQVYLTKKVIIAVSPSNAKKINGIPRKEIFMDIYHKLNPVALYRIYAIYPKKKGTVWFQDLNRIITNSPIQTIIPINKETGLIMISYSDYKKAISMNREKNIEKFIKKELNKLFPEKDIPSPDFITGYFWDDGVNYWKPGYRGKIESKKSIESVKDVYIMGEPYSNLQGWMEGALQSAHSVFNRIQKENPLTSNSKIIKVNKPINKRGIKLGNRKVHNGQIRIKNRNKEGNEKIKIKNRNKEGDEKFKIKNRNKEWNKKFKIKNRNKEISLEELSKHSSVDDAWIGLNGNIYDVTSFIPKHPGGSAILKGIGREYTRQWKKVSSHRMNRDRIANILSDRLVGKLKLSK